MTGPLETALREALIAALPELLGGDSPAVRLEIDDEIFELAPRAADPEAGEARPEDRRERFAFDPESPAGPYRLSRPPYPGPRPVRLVTEAGDRLALSAAEVEWSAGDPRSFTLKPPPRRDLAAARQVEVLYAVVAAFATLRIRAELTLGLAADDEEKLAAAEALTLAVVELRHAEILAAAEASYSGGDYGAELHFQGLEILRGERPAADRRALRLRAEIELKASSALGVDEGLPIERVVSPGRPPSERPVDVDVEVEA